MELKDIVAIAGQSGLHKIVGRSKNGLIVETIGTGRRFSTSFQDKVSVLEDIAIYTLDEDMKLSHVFVKLKDSGEVPAAKEEMKKLRTFLISLINLDSDRVYDNDIKKLLTWYHLLKDVLDFSKLIQSEESPEAAEETPAAEVAAEEKKEEPSKEAKPKKTSTRTKTPKADTPKAAAPKANSKGAGAAKTTYRPKSV